MHGWAPVSGQVALIEPGSGGGECLTGVVLDEHDDTVVIDLGASAERGVPAGEVTASFFSPEALYRVAGTMAPHDDMATVIDLTVHDVERVQRRQSPRIPVAVPVALSVVLSNLDEPGDFVSVAGTTVNISEGGCRVMLDHRYPAGSDPTVTLHLPHEELLALAAVLEEMPQENGRYEYRLVFLDEEDHHRKVLAGFLATCAA